MQLLNTATVAVGSGTSQKYNDVAGLWDDGTRTIYVDGTFTNATTVVVECSPDPLSVADSSSRWHTLLTTTAPTFVNTNYKYKKVRARVSTIGTGTLIVEML